MGKDLRIIEERLYFTKVERTMNSHTRSQTSLKFYGNLNELIHFYPPPENMKKPWFSNVYRGGGGGQEVN